MTCCAARSSPVVAGIDVGGPRKGFHLVVLQGTQVRAVQVRQDAAEVARACVQHEVALVGIDAPCRWGLEGSGRSAERALARERIACFATPSRARALATRSGFYDWMLNGERLYAALAATHPVLMTERYGGGRACFETFPHAVTCALLGRELASAKFKRVQRRTLLAQAGIDTSALSSIDAIDAAVCALTAAHLAGGQVRAYGDAAGGYIFVPAPARS